MTDELREMADYLWNSPQKTHNQIDEVLRKAFDMGKQEGREEANKVIESYRDKLSDMHTKGCRFDDPPATDENLECLACWAFETVETFSQKPKEG